MVLNSQDYNRELFCVELPAVRDGGNSMYNVNYAANTGTTAAANESQTSFALGTDGEVPPTATGKERFV